MDGRCFFVVLPLFRPSSPDFCPWVGLFFAAGCDTLIQPRAARQKRGDNHEPRRTQKKYIFRKDRLCALGRRRVRRPRQHLALSVSGRQIRRRYFPARLHHSGHDVRLYHDRSRDLARPHDRQEPGRRVQHVRQLRLAEIRRLDQRDHPHPHRAVLLGHRRLGRQISARSSRTACPRSSASSFSPR